MLFMISEQAFSDGERPLGAEQWTWGVYESTVTMRFSLCPTRLTERLLLTLAWGVGHHSLRT